MIREFNFHSIGFKIVEGKVRPQDLYLMFLACSSAKSQALAYDYFKKNHAKLSELLGGPTEGVFQHCFEFSVCKHSTGAVAKDLEVRLFGAIKSIQV